MCSRQRFCLCSDLTRGFKNEGGGADVCRAPCRASPLLKSSDASAAAHLHISRRLAEAGEQGGAAETLQMQSGRDRRCTCLKKKTLPVQVGGREGGGGLEKKTGCHLIGEAEKLGALM